MLLILLPGDVHQVISGRLHGVNEAKIRLRHASFVLVLRRGEGQDVLAQHFAVGGAVVAFPERHDGVPEGVAEARVVGVAVLADDRFDGRGVLEG